jgi:hypothetical protein
MRSLVHYLPIATTLLSIVFTTVLYRHWRRKPDALYLLWWTLGVAIYGVGTLTESLTTLLGWNVVVFKSWYISGALLGGAPLAQGTVYLLMSNRVAHRLAAALLSLVLTASVFVLLSPINYEAIETYRLSGSVMGWQWTRLFSPIINTYALIFLVGGAAWSAWKYWRSSPDFRARAWGNTWIAVGALLPGIGGSFTRFGYVEVLYVTEIIGLSLIWLGYHVISNDQSRSIHAKQVKPVREAGQPKVQAEPVLAD